MRYGSLLLDLAEAANETGNIPLALDQLIEIRKRAGIEPGGDSMYGLPANPSQDETRELIRRERFIQLAFDGYRLFDIRRLTAVYINHEKSTNGRRNRNNANAFTY